MIGGIFQFLQKIFGPAVFWFLGILLFSLAAAVYRVLQKKRPQNFDRELTRAFEEDGMDIEFTLTNIELRLEKILAQTSEIQNRMSLLEEQVSTLLTGQGGTAEGTGFAEQVYRAYEGGKKVTELAREFGRDKGEIELILNLIRLKREGTG